MNDTAKDLELTPVCDPPQRPNGDTPIGHCWWIEPSHPEIDPASSLVPSASTGPAPEES